MAGKKSVLLGALGLGALAVGIAGWLLMGGPSAPSEPKEAPAPEAAPLRTEEARPAAAPHAPAAPAPVAAPRGDGSLRGRLVRGVAKAPLPGAVAVSGPGLAPLRAAAGADGCFVLDGVPRSCPLVLHAESPGLLPGDFQFRVPASGFVDLGDIVLGGPLTLEVRVRDAGDRPVAGAVVALHRSRIWNYSGLDWITVQLDPGDPPPPAGTRTTDETGRAVFEDAAAGAWSLRTAAKGFAEDLIQVSLVEGAARDPVRVVLGPACSLTGTVLSREGKPVPSVKVHGLRNNMWGAGYRDAAFDTGPDGKYRLEGLAHGVLALSVDTAPGTRVTTGTVEIPDVSVWDIRLPAVSGVKGKVLDDATGAPVAGAEVTAQTWPDSGGPGQGLSRTTSAQDGTFAIPGLPPGNLGPLGVRAKGYLSYPGSEGGMMMQQTRLREGESFEKEVRLRRGAAIKGRVLDRAGKPVAGAMVRFKSFNPRTGMDETPAAKTDAEGAYRIESAPPVRGLVRAEAPGYFQQGWPAQEWQALQQGNLPETCSVEVPAEGEVLRDLVLQSTGSVEGVVADKDGKPAAGIPVVIVSKGGKVGGGGSGGLSDAEGKYRAVDVSPGEDLLASAVGPGGAVGSSEPFRLDEGGTVAGIRISLKAGATIAGRVRREDAGSAQGATLRLIPGKKDAQNPWNWDWQRTSAAVRPVGPDGAFRAEGLAPGTYTAWCEAEGAASSEGPVVEVADGEVKEGVEVVLGEEKRISGKVQNPEGSPVAGAAVRVKDTASRQMYYMGPDAEPVVATTDAAGAFTLRGLGKGTFQVSVRAAGYSEASENAEGGRDDLVVTLKPGLSIEGVVVDETTGAPVAGISIFANPKTPPAGGMRMSLTANSGKDGTFALRDLAPGAYNLTVAAGWNEPSNDYAQKVVNDLEAGAKDVRVALVKGLAISGKVSDEAGKPVGGMYVQAVGKDANGNPDWAKQRGMQVQANGTFRLGGLPPGVYDLTFNSSFGPGGGGGVAPTSVKAVAAGTEDLAVTVKHGQPISGRVVDEKGNAPGQQGNILVVPTDAKQGSNETTWGNFQADGVFTTQPLEPGRSYDLTVQRVQGFIGGTAKAVAAGTKDVAIVLRKGGSISGRVVDESGKPVGKGVPVTAMADGATPGEPGSGSGAMTGDGGEFNLEGLGDRRFRLTTGGNQSDWRPNPSTESWEPGATGVVLKAAAGVTFTGRLLDARGNAVKPQWIRATPVDGDGRNGSYARPADDGTFTLKGLAPGKVKLQCWLGNKQLELGTVEAPGTDVAVTVPD